MCNCDFGTAEFMKKSTHQARKEHFCSECYSLILPGQVYMYQAGKYEGDFFQIKTCSQCLKLIANAQRLDCFCHSAGSLFEELENFEEEELREINIITSPACRISDRLNTYYLYAT